VLSPGHYVGPWRFTHRVRVRASAGATLSPGDAEDPGHATLILERGGQVEGLAIEAPAKGYALRVERSTATFARLHLTGNGEAGLYFVGSKVRASECDFEGNAYGVLGEGPSTLDLGSSRFHGNVRAGVAVVSTATTLKDNQLVGPFYEAAVTAIHCDPVKLSGNRTTAAGAVGLKFIASKAVLSGGSVEGARSDAQGLEGNGLYAYHSTIDAAGLHIDATKGVGVSVIGGSVSLRHCEIRHSTEAAASVSSGGTLTLSDTLVADAPVGVFVEPDGVAETSTARFERVEQPRVSGK